MPLEFLLRYVSFWLLMNTSSSHQHLYHHKVIIISCVCSRHYKSFHVLYFCQPGRLCVFIKNYIPSKFVRIGSFFVHTSISLPLAFALVCHIGQADLNTCSVVFAMLYTAVCCIEKAESLSGFEYYQSKM